MSQGTFYDTMIRLNVLKNIFVFRPEIDLLPRGKSMLFGQK